MSTLVNVIVNFTSDTIISFASGCISFLTVTGLCYGVSFLVYKRIIHHHQKKKTTSTESENKELNQANGAVKNYEYTSNESQRITKLTDEQRFAWFLKKNESGKSETFGNFQEYLKVTVASANVETRLRRDGKIREFLEHLVKSLISGNLDDVPLTPLSSDVQYETVFSTYHPKLSSTLTALSTSLHSNKDSESLDEAVRPSTLYNKLRSVIADIQEQATLLPSFQDYDTEVGSVSIETHIEGQSYEEILSTAILNKIISRSQSNKGNAISPDLTDNVDFKFYQNSWNSSPKQYSLTIEERIEEITTEYQLSEEESESVIECSAKFNLLEKHRAHFPELGKDIVDGEGSLETQPETECLSNGDLEHVSNDRTSYDATKLPEEDSNYNSSLEQDLATPPKPGTIAEREHLKWERATPIPNNPYSKENIEKRNLANFLPKNCTSSVLSNGNEDEECTFNSTNSNISKYGRDYYINADNEANKNEEKNHIEAKTDYIKSTEKPTENGFSDVLPCENNVSNKPKSNLVRVSSWSERKRPEIEIKKRLPSVKELAKQFSGQITVNETKKTPILKNQTVHSLTARSMSKEFREGLKNNMGKTFNRNILSKYVDEADKNGEILHSQKKENGLDLGNGVVIWENKI